MSCENKINFLRVRIISYGVYVLRSSADAIFLEFRSLLWMPEHSLFVHMASNQHSRHHRLILLEENYSVFHGDVNK